MTKPATPSRKFTTAERRWAGVGPYYAMFPVDFADSMVRNYTSPGATVLDPFAGRGTAIFSAAANERTGIGIELNPVGWVYAQAKLHTASKSDVIDRLRHIGRLASNRTSKPPLPPFFARAFTIEVRRFLAVARKHLQWRQDPVDWTLMALLLVNLHGKIDASLSNQMRQTKSMSPPYALNWWRTRQLYPPDIDPVAFMEKRIEWRYAMGSPNPTKSFVYLGDAITRLPDAKKRAQRLSLPSARLLLTSPPYCGVTNYHYDQWLRLWLLGGPPNALARHGRYRGRFAGVVDYKKLLFKVFDRAKALLHPKAVIYVRTDHRDVTLHATIEVLAAVFPKKRLFQRIRDIEKPTQTHLFRERSSAQKPVKCAAEVDVVLLPAA